MCVGVLPSCFLCNIRRSSKNLSYIEVFTFICPFFKNMIGASAEPSLYGRKLHTAIFTQARHFSIRTWPHDSLKFQGRSDIVFAKSADSWCTHSSSGWRGLSRRENSLFSVLLSSTGVQFTANHGTSLPAQSVGVAGSDAAFPADYSEKQYIYILVQSSQVIWFHVLEGISSSA